MQSLLRPLTQPLRLPGGSGLDLMRHLGDAHALTGIALSGFGTQEDVAASREAGFAVHLTKPVDLAVLRATVAELLEAKEIANAQADPAERPVAGL
jgi:DNA-binding response OmpR family regulator